MKIFDYRMFYSLVVACSFVFLMLPNQGKVFTFYLTHEIQGPSRPNSHQIQGPNTGYSDGQIQVHFCSYK